MLCPGSSVSPRFTASCCLDGSLAVIQPLWVQKTSEIPSMSEGVAIARTCAHSTSNTCTRLGRHCKTTRPSQSPSHGATSPVLVDRDRSFRNWSVYQNWNPRWVSPHGLSLAPMGQQTLARTQGENPEEKIWNFDYLAAKMSKTATDIVPNTPQWSQHRSGDQFQNSARSAKARSVESVQQCHKIRQKQSTTTISRAHSVTSWKHSSNVPR